MDAERLEWIERWLTERNERYTGLPLDVAVSMGLELLDEVALLKEARRLVFSLYETWDPEPPEQGHPVYELALLFRHPDALMAPAGLPVKEGDDRP